MGFGFRCGFLGLLHMEIVQERLEREYDLDLITTAPTVVYKCELPGGGEMNVDNPCNLPDKHDNLQEPYCRSQPPPSVPSVHAFKCLRSSCAIAKSALTWCLPSFACVPALLLLVVCARSCTWWKDAAVF